jgi:FMN phosphatase YigB (HAD superfamily)
MHWFIDFDDTLAIGPITWALSHVFPALIRDNNLPHDPATFDAAILHAQQRGNENVDESVLLDEFFTQMNWPLSLKENFLHQIYNGYVPTLFDDARPFLERLKQADQRVYVISNNNHAPYMIEQMGIRHYFTDVFTPKGCGGLPGKPQRDMWDYMLARHSFESGSPVAMIGDDPWSDGVFSEQCGVQCWILDRMNRFADLYPTKGYCWVKSLAAIHIA